MSEYTPTNWQSGDIATAARFNKLEQGVGAMSAGYTPHVWQDGNVPTAAQMNALEQAVAAGGGGSSDFSTATLTIADPNEIGLNIAIPEVVEEGELGEGAPAMVNAVVQTWATGSYTVALYKGGLMLEIPYNISTSGNISDLGDNFYFITGNCSITVLPF